MQIKICPRCHHMVSEPAGSRTLHCPQCLSADRVAPLVNAFLSKRPVAIDNRGSSIGPTVSGY